MSPSGLAADERRPRLLLARCIDTAAESRGDLETGHFDGMTVATNIEAECTGGTLERLAELIALREQYLKGESTQSAVIATAINVTTSLRASTKKAKDTPKDGEHFKVSLVPGTMGWRGGKGHRQRRFITGGHRTSDRPILLLKGHTYGNMYKVEVPNAYLRPKGEAGNLNAPYYLIAAPDEATAIARAKIILARALKKEVGMAKYALGIAQAKMSDRPMNSGAPSGSNQMQKAHDAARISTNSGDGYFSMEVNDNLRYAGLALKNGPGDVELAMKKAANRTAAIINKMANYRMDEPIPTPFPEVASSKSRKGSK